MALKDEFAEARVRWKFLAFYQKFEHAAHVKLGDLFVKRGDLSKNSLLTSTTAAGSLSSQVFPRVRRYSRPSVPAGCL
jgi:hypothetical protein